MLQCKLKTVSAQFNFPLIQLLIWTVMLINVYIAASYVSCTDKNVKKKRKITAKFKQISKKRTQLSHKISISFIKNTE